MKDKSGTLLVSGSGTVIVAPDEAQVRLSVLTEGKTAAMAIEANAKRTQSVIDAVSAQPNHGVTTTGLSVNPIISYDPNTHVGTIVGFRASNGVEVKTKPGYAGQIYDAGIEAGANQSSGISFRLQNETPHREEALRLAVKEAFKEAKLVAKAADVDLEGPETIQIGSGGGRTMYMAQTIDAKAVPTPVLPDELSVSATISITFRIRG